MKTLTLKPRFVNPSEISFAGEIVKRGYLRPRRSRFTGLRRRLISAFTDGAQWLEVNCSDCGLLAEGDRYELEACEKVQAEHSQKFRGHRVSVELFFQECVSTRINETPKEPDDDLYLDPRD